MLGIEQPNWTGTWGYDELLTPEESAKRIGVERYPMFAVGFVMAFIVALIAIKTFLQLIKRISFIPFAIYRFIVAAAVYVVFF